MLQVKCQCFEVHLEMILRLEQCLVKVCLVFIQKIYALLVQNLVHRIYTITLQIYYIAGRAATSLNNSDHHIISIVLFTINNHKLKLKKDHEQVHTN
jgi:hypothetical protein